MLKDLRIKVRGLPTKVEAISGWGPFAEDYALEVVGVYAKRLREGGELADLLVEKGFSPVRITVPTACGRGYINGAINTTRTIGERSVLVYIGGAVGWNKPLHEAARLFVLETT